MSGNYPSSALRHGQQVKPQIQLIGRQWQISYEANICFDIGIIVVKLLIAAVSKIEVVAKCNVLFTVSSQAAPQKCSELLTANLVMDGQNLSEVEV